MLLCVSVHLSIATWPNLKPFLFTSRVIYHWGKCIRKDLHVSLPLQRPVVWRLHYIWLLNKATMVCSWNKIWTWTVGILPNHLWVCQISTSLEWKCKNYLNYYFFFCQNTATDHWRKNLITGAYYQLNIQSSLTWGQADTSCKQQAASLVSIVEPSEQALISGEVPPGGYLPELKQMQLFEF